MFDPTFFSFLLMNPQIMNLVLQGAIPFQALQQAFQQVRQQMPQGAPTVNAPPQQPPGVPSTGSIQPAGALPGAFTALPQNQAVPSPMSMIPAPPPPPMPPMPVMAPMGLVEPREPGGWQR